MVNHANGSDHLFDALGRERVVLGFPSAAGSIERGVDVYVDIAEQPTSIESTAPDIAAVLRSAGFRVKSVSDMDSWLKRHAVFITAVAGALYDKQGDARLLSFDKNAVRTFILAVREGWSALDGRSVAPAPLALHTILCWVPMPLAVRYWCRVFGSWRGGHYFARHIRNTSEEIAALVADVRALVLNHKTPHLRRLYDAIDHRCTSRKLVYIDRQERLAT